MTVYELIQELAKHEPDAELKFNFIPIDDELRLDIDDVEIDGSVVTIQHHDIGLEYHDTIYYRDSAGRASEIIINLREE